MTAPNPHPEGSAWRHFVGVFLCVFFIGAAIVYIAILLVDPYGVVAFSLPLDRRIISIDQRHMYPQIVRSKRYDSFVIGSSTGRLLDPALLDKEFGGRFANLSMNDMQAVEQKTMIELVLRTAGRPRMLIVGIDGVWCSVNADKVQGMHGFPHWMYDDNPWNDYLYLLNTAAAEATIRLLAFQFGLYKERIRGDGYQVFTPPEERYDLAKARKLIWSSREPQAVPDLAPRPLSDQERRSLSFPALAWLDNLLGQLPPSSVKVLAYMPIHVAAQPWPGTRDAAIEAECKARIAEIGRNRGAKVIDWRIASRITREDSNYWDNLHYRVPIATRVAEELAEAVLLGEPSEDYRIVVP